MKVKLKIIDYHAILQWQLHNFYAAHLLFFYRILDIYSTCMTCPASTLHFYTPLSPTLLAMYV